MASARSVHCDVRYDNNTLNFQTTRILQYHNAYLLVDEFTVKIINYVYGCMKNIICLDMYQ